MQDSLPHSILEEAMYKHPNDWAGQLSYITSRANLIIKEQSQQIIEHRDEIIELKRDKAFLRQANQSLAYA